MRGVLEIPAHDWSVSMYKTEKSVQMTFEDFNQSCGMKLNVRDEWIVVANNIDWAAVEENYMAFFPSKRGRPAVSARMAQAVSAIPATRAGPACSRNSVMPSTGSLRIISSMA